MVPTSKPSSMPALLLPPPQRRPLSSLWSTSPYKLQPTVMGDVIGTESGDCMMSELEDCMEPKPKPKPKPEPEPEPSRMLSGAREKSGRTREFPPPITLLRETGRMPWVLKRECTNDGRLIMKLVPHEDDIVYCEKCGYPMNEEEEEESELGDLEFNEEPEGLEHVDDEEEEEEEEEEEVGFEVEEEFVVKYGSNASEKCSVEKEGDGGGDLRKCLTYSGELVLDSDSLWKANGFLGRPGSAPLLRPMTPVM